MKCPQCGAEIEVPGSGSSFRCRYCRTEVQGPKPTAGPFAGFDSLFADQNGDGVPDALEGLLKKPGTVQLGQVSYTVNGVRCEKLEDVPAELRGLLAKAQGLLDDPPSPVQVTRTEVHGPSRNPGWVLFAVLLAFLAGVAVVLFLL